MSSACCDETAKDLLLQLLKTTNQIYIYRTKSEVLSHVKQNVLHGMNRSTFNLEPHPTFCTADGRQDRNVHASEHTRATQSLFHIQHYDKRHTCEQTVALAEPRRCWESLGSGPVAQHRSSHDGLIETDKEWTENWNTATAHVLVHQTSVNQS